MLVIFKESKLNSVHVQQRSRNACRKNIAVSLQASTYVVERKYLSKDESGNTGDGSEDGRAGEGSGASSDGRGVATGGAVEC